MGDTKMNNSNKQDTMNVLYKANFIMKVHANFSKDNTLKHF